jgi:aldose 1-epimerase
MPSSHRLAGFIFCCALVSAVTPVWGAQVSVARSPFGALPGGARIQAFTLTNASGMQVRVIDYGAIIQSLKVPDRHGALADVVLGYDSLDGYVDNPQYIGALIGRYANRIGKAQFTLDGKTYKLANNSNGNTLHGGRRGFNKVVWKGEPFQKPGQAGVTLTYTSPDGDEGFPGALSMRVVFTLNDSNELSLDYSATTNKPTVVNLTHHDYWNLSGEGSGDVLNTRLQINADRFTPVDTNLIPLGTMASVSGTPFDFHTLTPIGAHIGANDPQLKLGSGYDHNFVINHHGNDLAVAARAEDPKSGRVLEVRTTEPGVQFYTANFLDVIGKSGHAYEPRDAFCLETQHFPDSPNKRSFPTTVLRPGQTFHSTTVYAFSVK